MTATTSEALAVAPCVRCAKVQRTCCQRAEILLTEGDVARIAAHTGSDTFFEHRAPEAADYVEFDEDDPDWVGLTVRADGQRRMLRRAENGDCGFLGAAGCVLPTETRPLVCRLYPWDYTAEGLLESAGEYCPTELFGGLEPMNVVLGIETADARRWHVQLYEELRHGTA
ncbi:YkgJ family cysteine cluster protein [Engelhardtia mirabilis]|uniref:Flagellin N-methylase n=1 Tax=Engelhardtia mirabilis TaxID=2528011 RepID=A0A518BFA8_9BACT|nr:hypothetical protein Pla133_07070 [Planctomycetes bacterium Pla133]QDU99967.1 hypothetical protein Pla86_07060 [Planctomycetes bacterium Pla86]